MLLELRSHRREHVIRIHYNVNEGINEAEEGDLTTGEESHSDPAGQRHQSVMIHVKKRYLTLLLSENEEYRVEELDELAHVVEPDSPSHLKKYSRRGKQLVSTFHCEISAMALQDDCEFIEIVVLKYCQWDLQVL